MILLAVDTSHAKGSLALRLGDGALKTREWRKQAMHSEIATLELQALLGTMPLTELTHLAVNIGPGSFTGLRVGINLVRTLAYTLERPVFVFNTLELLARKYSNVGDSVFVAIRAIQNFYYAAAYESRPDSMHEMRAPHSLSDPRTTASALGCTKVLIEGESSTFTSETHALDLAQQLGEDKSGRPFFTWQNVKPLYVRASEAEEKLKRGIIKSGPNH